MGQEVDKSPPEGVSQIFINDEEAETRGLKVEREAKLESFQSRTKDAVAALEKIEPHIYVDTPLLSRPYDSSTVDEISEPKTISTCSDDAAIQAIAPLVDGTAQTTWHRRVNKIVQYESITAGDNYLASTMESQDITQFLRKVMPMMELALLEERVGDIFAKIREVDPASIRQSLSNGKDNEAMEVHRFLDLKRSKGKVLRSVQFFPSDDNRVAASACAIGSNDKATYGHILVWNRRNQLHPQAILRTPTDCPVFRVNPTDETCIVGGGDNGQIILWKLSREVPSAGSAGASPTGQSVVKPITLSHPEYGHRSAVADIVWLPADSQINAQGKILSKNHLTDASHQFISVSGDCALFWDTRIEQILAGQLSHVAKPKLNKIAQSQIYPNKDEDGAAGNMTWAPIFRIKIKRIEGSGELSFAKALLSSTTQQDDKDTVASKIRLICASEDELVAVDWSRKQQGKSGEGDTSIGSPEYVDWMKRDCTGRSCLSLQVSPFFPGIVLCVSDWSFRLWKLDATSTVPLFTSPTASARLTDGRWSPTRPSVLLLSRSDGSVDIWDFASSTYGPSATLSLLTSEITSMDLLHHGHPDNQGKDQLTSIAIGDLEGSLHVYALSGKFSKAILQEKELMDKFICRKCAAAGQSDMKLPANIMRKGMENADEDAEVYIYRVDPNAERAYLELESKYAEQFGLVEV